MRIRAATRPDLVEIWRTEQAVFGVDLYPRFFFRQAHDLWGGLVRVAELPGGGLAGHVIGAVSRRPEEAWVLSAAVHPAHRRTGVGGRLFEDLFHTLAGSTVREVRLTVAPDNGDALRLYERLGFRVMHEEADYYGGGERRYVMTAPVPGP